MARMHTILRYGIQEAWSCRRAGVWAGEEAAGQTDLGSHPSTSPIHLHDLGQVTSHL